MNVQLRFVVTGVAGQVVKSLLESAHAYSDIEVIALGRPQLELMNTESIAGIVRAASPDIIVSAAAYTDVDRAEREPEIAFAVNSRASAALALVAKSMEIPIIQLSTDYVFDGRKDAPYVENDWTNPLGIYGKSKLDGERAIATISKNHVILRTSWIYSPFGRNFLRTMLHAAQAQSELKVVADQVGNPTSALDLATAIVMIGKNLLTSDNLDLRGTFHLTGTGEASWADFAEEIFKASLTMGGPFAAIKRISSEDYPAIARRPVNSRLSCQRIQQLHAVSLPDWRVSAKEVVRRLIQE